jgi:hypothetical protein
MIYSSHLSLATNLESKAMLGPHLINVAADQAIILSQSIAVADWNLLRMRANRLIPVESANTGLVPGRKLARACKTISGGGSSGIKRQKSGLLCADRKK